MQRILVVEDDWEMNQGICYVLKENGYTSVSAHSIAAAKAEVNGKPCPVTPTEFRILQEFLSNKGQLLTYGILLDRLWDGGSQFVDRHALAVNVNRLRGKIEDREHKYISNVYGMGYQWIGQ